jgi:hypothetical protein
MGRAPTKYVSAIGVAVALFASTTVRADCPDGANNVPGCQFDSSADFDAFHLQDFSGLSSFDGTVGHAGPGSLAMAETTGGFVANLGECFTLSYPTNYRFGAYLSPAPATITNNCQVCIYLYFGPGCGTVDLVQCAYQAAALAPGWTRFEASASTPGFVSANLGVACALNDGGIVHIDDAFAGTLIFFDSFESGTPDIWTPP